MISEKRININIEGREYRDYSSNILSHDYEMVLPDYSKYVASYYVKTNIFDLPSSTLMVEKFQNWNNMATHNLHHKIDEVKNLLKFIEKTTKRVLIVD